MKDLYLIGAGGFSTEILHLVELIQEKSKRWNQVFFIDETMEPFSKELRGVKVVGGLEVIEKTEAEIDVVIVVLHHFVDSKYNYFSLDFSIS